jgi:uncharacterized protein YecE (DUF72 family)
MGKSKKSKKRSGGGRPIYVGTSGWTYDDWQERFYPADVKGADRLQYYATRFDTVEVNASFYRTPTQTMIKAWNRRLGEDFHLVLKGNRRVTHRKKLKDHQDALDFFMQRSMQLDRLEVILWQLPPSLHKDVKRLDTFLDALPGDVRYAVEFRHPSWWDEEVAACLAQHAAAFVAVSHPALPAVVRPTTDFLYMRFHGRGENLYQWNYSKKELAEWAARLRPHLENRALYAFFNNDHHAHAPENAAVLRALLSEA